jgi:hypothetical protein
MILRIDFLESTTQITKLLLLTNLTLPPIFLDIKVNIYTFSLQFFNLMINLYCKDFFLQ